MGDRTDDGSIISLNWAFVNGPIHGQVITLNWAVEQHNKYALLMIIFLAYSVIFATLLVVYSVK